MPDRPGHILQPPTPFGPDPLLQPEVDPRPSPPLPFPPPTPLHTGELMGLPPVSRTSARQPTAGDVTRTTARTTRGLVPLTGEIVPGVGETATGAVTLREASDLRNRLIGGTAFFEDVSEFILRMNAQILVLMQDMGPKPLETDLAGTAEWEARFFRMTQAQSQVKAVADDLRQVWNDVLVGQAKTDEEQKLIDTFSESLPKAIDADLFAALASPGRVELLRQEQERQGLEQRVSALGPLTGADSLFPAFSVQQLAAFEPATFRQMLQRRQLATSLLPFFGEDFSVEQLRGLTPDLALELLQQRQEQEQRSQFVSSIQSLLGITPEQALGLTPQLALELLRQKQQGAFRAPRGLVLQPVQRVE